MNRINLVLYPSWTARSAFHVICLAGLSSSFCWVRPKQVDPSRLIESHRATLPSSNLFHRSPHPSMPLPPQPHYVPHRTTPRRNRSQSLPLPSRCPLGMGRQCVCTGWPNVVVIVVCVVLRVQHQSSSAPPAPSWPGEREEETTSKRDDVECRLSCSAWLGDQVDLVHRS